MAQTKFFYVCTKILLLDTKNLLSLTLLSLIFSLLELYYFSALKATGENDYLSPESILIFSLTAELFLEKLDYMHGFLIL